MQQPIQHALQLNIALVSLQAQAAYRRAPAGRARQYADRLDTTGKDDEEPVAHWGDVQWRVPVVTCGQLRGQTGLTGEADRKKGKPPLWQGPSRDHEGAVVQVRESYRDKALSFIVWLKPASAGEDPAQKLQIIVSHYSELGVGIVQEGIVRIAKDFADGTIDEAQLKMRKQQLLEIACQHKNQGEKRKREDKSAGKSTDGDKGKVGKSKGKSVGKSTEEDKGKVGKSKDEVKGKKVGKSKAEDKCKKVGKAEDKGKKVGKSKDKGKKVGKSEDKDKGEEFDKSEDEDKGKKVDKSQDKDEDGKGSETLIESSSSSDGGSDDGQPAVPKQAY